ncbi:uncharacterized protein LOC108682328 [Hyalella azteca]|uniref:Uncharacterized protein LOC108682328 n=1 Tax=Hyalella azteca TaxID=294128 RepID=A0A8B7PLA1_HYAAZ|nr:uncharacterized protein LOC108682328 [Hyalella azteca]
MSHCDQCSAKFTILKRKHQCDACQLCYCSDCLTRVPTLPSPQQASSSSSQFQTQAGSFVAGFNNFANSLINGSVSSNTNVRRNCHKCSVFLQWPVNVAAVSALRVKDLRFYLSRHHINASTCTEKSEMTALVVNQLKRYRMQQQQEHQQRQSTSSSSGFQSSGTQNANAPSFMASQSYSRHTNQPFHRTPDLITTSSSSTIRDDGIRVQGMSAGECYNCDSDSIRVFASSNLTTSNVSPSNSVEDDGFVVVGHNDLPPSNVSSVPHLSDIYSTNCDTIVDSNLSRNLDNDTSRNTDPAVSFTTRDQSLDAGNGAAQSSVGNSASQSSAGNSASQSSAGNSASQSSTRNSAAPSNTGNVHDTQPLVDDIDDSDTRREGSSSPNVPPVAAAAAANSSPGTDTSNAVPCGTGTRANVSEVDYIKLEDLADEASVRALSVRQCRVLLSLILSTNCHHF